VIATGALLSVATAVRDLRGPVLRKQDVRRDSVP